MIYRFDVKSLPQAVRAYSVIRRTVWQVADPYHILIYIKQGSCTLETGGKQYVLREGDLFFLPQNTMYIRRPIDDALCTMFYAHFRLPDMQTLQESRAREKTIAWKKEIDDALLQADFMVHVEERLYLASHMHLQKHQKEIEALISQCEDPENRLSMLHAMQISVWFLQILLLASGSVLDRLMDDHTVLPAERTPEKLRQAIVYIRQHESEKITLTDLCSACAVSKQMMMRYFRSNLNITPTEYITRHKMNRALELFARAPDLTIKEIAWEVGYDDQCYFSRVFTRVMGETPTDFRNRVTGFDEKKHVAEAGKTL